MCARVTEGLENERQRAGLKQRANERGRLPPPPPSHRPRAMFNVHFRGRAGAGFEPRTAELGIRYPLPRNRNINLIRWIWFALKAPPGGPLVCKLVNALGLWAPFQNFLNPKILRKTQFQSLFAYITSRYLAVQGKKFLRFHQTFTWPIFVEPKMSEAQAT